MTRLEQLISDLEYITNSLWALRKIHASGSCNDCGQAKTCVCRPDWGERVRYNCPFYEERIHENSFIECGYIMTAKDRSAMEADIASKTGDDVRVVLLPYGAHVAEPKPEWIPVSEKLPEEKGRYIVYCTLTGIDRSIRTAMYYPGGWLEWDVDGTRGIARVVAWMPLPEPYEEGK